MNSADLGTLGFDEWWRFPAYGLPDLSIDRHPWAEDIRALLTVCPTGVSGVYAVRYRESFGRFSGESDIVYIGHTSNLQERLRQHLGLASGKGASALVEGMPVAGLPDEMRQFLHHLGLGSRNVQWGGASERFGFGEAGLYEVAWVEKATQALARIEERALLSRYESDHWELPPLNRRSGKE